MKKSELKLMIRQVVREEVRSALKDVLKTDSKPVVETKKQPKRKLTKNSILNDVLNETANDTDWKTMGNYDSSNMNDILKHSYNIGEEDIVKDTAVNAGVNPEQVPEHLEKALTRNYGDVLKAIDKKAQQTRNNN
tara:strand:+ start:199 stop:603 length:405 start_codon:yes stop_codon:yes gene_type:complete